MFFQVYEYIIISWCLASYICHEFLTSFNLKWIKSKSSVDICYQFTDVCSSMFWSALSGVIINGPSTGWKGGTSQSLSLLFMTISHSYSRCFTHPDPICVNIIKIKYYILLCNRNTNEQQQAYATTGWFIVQQNTERRVLVALNSNTQTIVEPNICFVYPMKA